MHVEIVKHTPDPEAVVALAARQCYSAGFVMDFASTPERDATLLRRVIGSGHASVAEHAVFTFAIRGVSRALSHQLVRFRMASFSQQSQRYTSVGEDYVIPETITNSQFGASYHYAIKLAYETYEAMVKAGVPKEDARYVLPNAAPTNLIMTMNARELLHAFNLRCCERAQWEIRELFNEILLLVKPIAPTIFENAGASCVAGPCPEGAMGCGKKQGNSPAGKE